MLHPLGGRHAGAGKTVATGLAGRLGLDRFPLPSGFQTGHPTGTTRLDPPLQLGNPFLQAFDDRLLADHQGLLPHYDVNQNIPVGRSQVRFRLHPSYVT